MAQTRHPHKKDRTATNPVVLRPGITIGASAAEDDDEFLFNCFEDNGIYADLENLSSPRYLLKGRTGAGKTALLRYLERKHPSHVIRIDPNFLCLQYISNSDVMRYLKECDVNLEPFFQIIWRHAFCTELLKRRYKIDDAEKARGMWNTFFGKLQPNKRRAIDYLKSFGVDLWPEMETRVTEIAKKVESQIGAELGATAGALQAKLKAHNAITEEERAEVQQKVNRILGAGQLSDLSSVITFLAEDVFSDDQQQFYIIVDDLDRFVVDDEIRYLLLRALIDSIKKFKPVRRVKFCIAVRSDLLELIFDRTRGPGFQTEKYEDSILELRWSKDHLIRLADTRIKEVFKRKYTGAVVTFDDIFPNQVDKHSAKEYIFDRTLRRPRDMIAFVNQAFVTAIDRKSVSTKILREAEGPYSEKRQNALIEEWIEVHPLVGHYFAPLKLKKAVFDPAALEGKDIDDLIQAVLRTPNPERDPLGKLCLKFYADELETWDVLQAYLSMMYKIGAVGVKATSQSPMRWAMADTPTISPTSFAMDSHVEVHPMLYRALGVVPKQIAN